jgi:hypothetical protein
MQEEAALALRENLDLQGEGTHPVLNTLGP